MATVVLSGGSPTDGFDMDYWNMGFVMGLLIDANEAYGNASELLFASGPDFVYANGSFVINAQGALVDGVITSFVHTGSQNSGPFGPTSTINVSGISVTVPSVIQWINTGNITAFQNAVFGAADTITGSAAPENINGYGGNDVIHAGAGNDKLDGGDGDDSLFGEDGNDVLESSLGIDLLDGGDGTDVAAMVYTSGTNTFSQIQASTALGFTMPNGTIIRNIEGVQMTGGSGDDTMIIDRPGLFSGLTFFNGGGGTDTLVADYSGTSIGQTENAPGYTLTSVERFDITGSSGNDNFTGGALNDTLSGGAGRDVLIGNAGADILTGGDGNDALDGGLGVDTLLGGDGNDDIAYSVGDYIDGGAGSDYLGTIDWTSATANITLSLAQLGAGITLWDGTYVVNMENTQLRTGSGNDVFNATGASAPSSASVWFFGNGGMDRLIMDFTGQTAVMIVNSAGNNQLAIGNTSALVVRTENVEAFSLTGGSGNDQFTTFAADDVLVGGAGNDTLNGAGGVNQLSGGDGNDVLSSAGGSATMSGDDGADTITSGSASDLVDGGAGTDLLIFDRSAFSTAFTLDTSILASVSGATLADGTVVRNMETFDLRTGNGNDVFQVNNLAGSGWALNGGGGTDRLVMDYSAASVSFSSSASNVSAGGVSLSLSSIEELYLTGTSSNNSLNGTSGNDVLNGAGGNDIIDGLGGVNTLIGGDGNDTITARNQDQIDGGIGTDFLTLDRTASPATTYTASAMASAGGQTFGDGGSVRNIERFTLQAGAGNDTITMDGVLSGAYILNAGAGNDTLVIDQSASNVAILFGFTSPITSGAGGSYSIAFSGIDQVIAYGSSAADTLYGSALDDVLNGNDGNDTLSGSSPFEMSTGADIMNGGNGIDTVTYNGSNAVTVYAGVSVPQNTGGAGIDTLISIENLIGSVFADFLALGPSGGTAWGSWGNDILYGDLGNDVLRGELGDDTMVGQGGADIAVGDTGNDWFYGGDGDDRYSETDVLTSTNAGAGVDVMFGGAGNDTFYGGANTDYAYGEDDNDALNGGDTWDWLVGGAGNDTLNGDGGGDYLWGGDGDDILNGGVNNGEIDTLVGENGDDTLNGGDGQDWLYGYADNDHLNGGLGGDVLVGGAGDDVLDGGAEVGVNGIDYFYGEGGNDTWIVGTNYSLEVIYDFTAGGTDDRIQWVGSGWTTFSQVMANAFYNGLDTYIFDGANTTVQLVGINSTNLTSADFMFA